jgi:hypothetical protein
MSKLKQLIGLQSSNLSIRELSRALELSVGAVSKYLRALRACGIGATEADALSEAELERRVFGITAPATVTTRAAPDCAWIANGNCASRELRSLPRLNDRSSEMRERYEKNAVDWRPHILGNFRCPRLGSGPALQE